MRRDFAAFFFYVAITKVTSVYDANLAAAEALIDAAGDCRIEASVTQFAVFEVTYVLQSVGGSRHPRWLPSRLVSW